MTPSPLSVALLNYATLGYLASMTAYLLYFTTRRRWAYVLGPVLLGVTAAAHATALADRWIQAGFYRPPWTNLYESLVFFSLGLAVVALVVDLRSRIRWVGVFVTPLVFSGLGLAYLVPVQEITPLVPSLQSWWILAHSCLAAFAYSGFIVASVVAFLYLVKTGMDARRLGFWTAVTILATMLLVGGSDVFLGGRYLMTEVILWQGKWRTHPIPGSDPVKFFEISVPYLPQLFWVTAALAVGSAFLHLARGESFWRRGRELLVLAFVSFLVLIGTMIGIIAGYQSVGMGSNPYSFALLVLMAAVAGFAIAYLYRGPRIAARLPEAKRLERLSYQVTLFAFPFMTLILITGAIWAHEAWGRYWGWDPKETTALVTWLIYAGYLHGRFTPGWTGKRAAILSIIGFFSVIFTYLGTNLVLSGLHSYGSQ
jgi:ABC-type transport system involved in cytochrome c biogenesis permease subunit